MKILSPDVAHMPEVIALLKEGGVIAHPADTCFGLAADLMNESALKKLQMIKGRDANKPMSIMLPATLKARLADYAVLDDFSRMVCQKLLPGPVTIVLPKGKKIPDYFFPDSPTVGIRIPYDFLTEDMLTHFHGPLITTSANRSNEPVCCCPEQVVAAFKGRRYQPDLFLAGLIHGDCLPSTVIRLQKGKILILREGPLKKEELEAILGISI